MVSALYLPGGELAAELRAATGVRGRVRVLMSFASRLRLAPLFAFAVVVLAALLRYAVSPEVRDRLILANSTNVANLEHGRIWTLLTSAVITDGQLRTPAVIQLLGLLAVGELLWGWRRLLIVFFAGNVVASCLIYAGLRTGLHANWLPAEIARASDVGTSYGAHAVSGAIALSLPVRARRLLVPLALLTVVLPLIDERTFTDVGHLLSTLIGFVAGLQMRRLPLAGRLRLPAMMRTDRIFAFVYPTIAAADDALTRALRLQERHRVHLYDATVAWPDQTHRVHVRETRDMDAVDGVLVGACLGVVAGTLAGRPLAGLVLFAVVVGAAARLHRGGLSNAAVQRAVGQVGAGGGALLLLARPEDEAALADELVAAPPAPPAEVESPAAVRYAG
jgi:uncharacterized membrane protein/multisubunit Na+/H+ antiporter MnhF subunit